MNTAFVRNPAPVAADRDGLAVIGTPAATIRGMRFRTADPGANTPPAGATQTPPAPNADPNPGTPAPSPSPTPAPAPGGTPAPAPGGNPPSGDPAPGGDAPVRFEDLDPRTQAYVRGLRQEAATERTARSAAEQARDAANERSNAILRAAGFNPDGTEYVDESPEALRTRLSERDTAVDNTRRENVVLRLAPTLNVNADRLLDSRSFTDRLHRLGTDDREGISALITEVLGQDPSFRSGPAPAASSGGTTHTGTPQNGERKTKSAAFASRYEAPARR